MNKNIKIEDKVNDEVIQQNLFQNQKNLQNCKWRILAEAVS